MTQELIIILSCLETMARKEPDVVITGIQNEDYPLYKSHHMGFALDVRATNLEDPRKFADRLRSLLGIYHPKDLKVLFGDEDHLDHIHVGLIL